MGVFLMVLIPLILMAGAIVYLERENMKRWAENTTKKEEK